MNNETKQTAVEWLMEHIHALSIDGKTHYTTTKQVYEQAKEMEKEQMIESYRSGRIDQQNNAESNYNRMSEEHYDETYGDGK